MVGGTAVVGVFAVVGSAGGFTAESDMGTEGKESGMAGGIVAGAFGLFSMLAIRSLSLSMKVAFSVSCFATAEGKSSFGRAGKVDTNSAIMNVRPSKKKNREPL